MLCSLATGVMASGAVETVRRVPLAATCGAGAAVLDGAPALLAATWGGESLGAAAPGLAGAAWAPAEAPGVPPWASAEAPGVPGALLAAAWDGVSAGAAAPGASPATVGVPAAATLGPMGKVTVSSSLRKVRVLGSSGDVDMLANGKEDSSKMTCLDTMILFE